MLAGLLVQLSMASCMFAYHTLPWAENHTAHACRATGPRDDHSLHLV